MDRYGLVIVGGGLASARAIKSYREAGGTGSIVLISADSEIPYHRPPLSKKYLRGEAEREDVFAEPEEFYRTHRVALMLETVVEKIDPGARAVLPARGQPVGYEKLLLASGAPPRRLPVPGGELPGVHYLRTLGDSTEIRDAAKTAKRAVVVGAGFIGMEVAASLTQMGVSVTMVHRGDGLFEVLGAPPISDFFADLYRERGVEVLLGSEVAEFRGEERLESAVTKDGKEFPADLSVIGIGVAPAVGFLAGSGITLDNGIVTNERFETSLPGIYAVGDVANFYDPLFGRQRRIEHWSNANYQGTEVGKVLAGTKGGFETVSTFFSEVFGTTVKVFGDSSAHSDLRFRGDIRDGSTIGLYLDGDRLVAAVLTGQDEETEQLLKDLIKAKARAVTPKSLEDTSTPLRRAFQARSL